MGIFTFDGKYVIIINVFLSALFGLRKGSEYLPINRKHRIELIFGMSAVMVAGMARAVLDKTALSYDYLISLLLMTVYLMWLFASRRRFPHKGMRRILTVSALLMMLWNTVDTLNNEFITKDSDLSRQIWYWYYLPMVMLPILLLMAAFYIGRTDSYELPRKWFIAFIPVLGLAVAIGTNDLHQLAFEFENGSMKRYRCGPLYYCAIGILIFSVVGILFKTLRSCSKRQFSRSFMLPAAITALGGIYFISYRISDEPMLFQRMYDFPDFTCLFFMCFWESLVITHMLPSNADHKEFFSASSISAGLVDDEMEIYLRGENSPRPTKDQLTEACVKEVLSGSNVLKVQPVVGGYFYWLEDISELQELNERLEETRSYLEEEHVMLDTANKLEESRRRTAEQNKLYDSISERLNPEFESLSKLLNELPADEEDFRTVMKRAAIDGVFIKRCSNLLLLAGSSDHIDSGELGLSVGESLGYLELSDIWGQADIPKGRELPAETVLFMYELFNGTAKCAFDDVHAIMVTLRLDDGIDFRIELDCECQPVKDETFSRAEELGGSIETVREDGSTYVIFTAKGEAVQ